MLARYAQAHQAFMVGHVSSLDPAYQAQVGVMQKVFAAHFSSGGRAARAQAFIYNTVQSSRRLLGVCGLRFTR